MKPNRETTHFPPSFPAHSSLCPLPSVPTGTSPVSPWDVELPLSIPIPIPGWQGRELHFLFFFWGGRVWIPELLFPVNSFKGELVCVCVCVPFVLVTSHPRLFP